MQPPVSNMCTIFRSKPRIFRRGTRSQHTKTEHNATRTQDTFHTAHTCFLSLSLALLEGILHSLPCLLTSRVLVYVNVSALWERPTGTGRSEGGEAHIADLIIE